MRVIDRETRQPRDVVCDEDGRLLVTVEGLEIDGLPTPTVQNGILLSDGDGWNQRALFGSTPPSEPSVGQPFYEGVKAWLWDGLDWVGQAPWILNSLDGNAIVNVPFLKWKVSRLLTEGDYFEATTEGNFYRWDIQSYRNFSDLPTVASIAVSWLTAGYNFAEQSYNLASVSKTNYPAVRVSRATIGSPPGANLRVSIEIREVR